MFENRVTRRMFGPKREEGAGCQRRLHNELHDLYASPSVIWVMKSSRLRWEGHVSWMREMRYAYNILFGKPEGKRPLRRPRHRWEDNRMDLRKIWWGGGAWNGCSG
jgi:hypothetical protein